jgi:hypothetical protein
VAWTWTAGRLDDGTRFHGTALTHGGQVVPYHPGYLQVPGRPLVPAGHTAATAELDQSGFPRAATVSVGDLVLDVRPVAFSPVPLAGPDGQTSRLCRALCRFHDRATGRSGAGWTEWHQPESLIPR